MTESKNLEQLRKLRAAQRTVFTKSGNALINKIMETEVDISAIQVSLSLLEKKMNILRNFDEQIITLMSCDDELTETDLEKEIESSDSYNEKFELIVSNFNNKFNPKIEIQSSISNISNTSGIPNEKRTKIKLPKIELRKFNGELANWLSFWSQFQRIHEDEEIDAEDKFQYLIQSTTPKSRARIVLEKYPPTAANYEKAINALKTRFGRPDLLIEVYVRELLKMVLYNLNNKVSLCSMFDKLESQLRSLESLGVKSDNYAAMLYPLVESCLPKEILKAWQRSSKNESESSLKDKLDALMNFLQKEVEDEEKILLASLGFSVKADKCKTKDIAGEEEIPTAAGLLAQTNSQQSCAFCDAAHQSANCLKAPKMSQEQRIIALKKRGCCFICLKQGHITRKCKVAIKCTLCGKRHLSVMCTNVKPVVNKNTPSTCPDAVVENNIVNHTQHQVFMQTLLVIAKSEHNELKVRVVIDTGSQRSYVSNKIVNCLKYKSLGEETIIHALFGGSQTEKIQHNTFRIRLYKLDKSYACNLIALDQAIICSCVTAVYHGPWDAELNTLGIEISDRYDGPVDILLGADVAGKLFTGKKKELSNGLTAVETLLGWTLMGKVKHEEAVEHSSTLIVTSLLSKTIDVSDLWRLDILGISDPGVKRSRKETEELVEHHFLQTVTMNKEGRYEVAMPWVEGHPPLPDNYLLTKKRYDLLIKKLKKEGFFDEYNKVFEDWLCEGIIERVPDAELNNACHYLPHRHVVKAQHLTTKIRPVFDASACSKGMPSLNSCLEKGINLIEMIPDLISRFRMSKIGVIGDIKKAFLQISLIETDRDYLRFLWVNSDGDTIVMRHRRVVFGVISSPFILGMVIQYHLKLIYEQRNDDSTLRFLELLKTSFYVDNCIVSVDSENEANAFIQQATTVMGKAKFHLRGWEKSFASLEQRCASVLGLCWDKLEDTLQIGGECLRDLTITKLTKRVVLSITQRIYDPIGFTCPTTLLPKLLIQKTWIQKLGWDAELTEDMKKEFMRWFNELHCLLEMKIPRWMAGDSDRSNWTIHCFSDASKDAYAAAVFLRSGSEDTPYVQLIQARARVAPVKKMTIPRLELLAASIGSRLTTSIQKAMRLEGVPVTYWTDSSTVVAWIHREELWTPFVWNRVQEIRALTCKENWCHLPGSDNPADLPSRGCTPSYLLKSKWWEGPAWLKLPPDRWPNQNHQIDEVAVAREKKPAIVSSVLNMENDEANDWYYRYFSSFAKIIRMVAWMCRFVCNLRNKSNRKGDLSVEELSFAEIVVWKNVQQECFRGSGSGRLKSLCPFTDSDGLIRLQTKCSYRPDSEDFRYPIVLPSKHVVVDRLIYYVHVSNCHIGVQGLLSLLRERFWLLQGRRVVRTLIKKCVICRRYDSKKMEVPAVPLPVGRVKETSTFAVTGVDLAGPLYLKCGEKAWICLYTCAVYRAVHYELIKSLSTQAFLQGFRRFVARRGRPITMWSDRGTNFVGAAKAFEQLDWNEIATYSSVRKIQWIFNPPSAPWWGGWWERLIRLLKGLLRKVLRKSSLTYEELYTVLCDCEAVVNNRPLTYLSEDPEDGNVLTPASFLRDKIENSLPDVDIIDGKHLTRRWRRMQGIRRHLRKRFRNEYLGQLALFSKSTPLNEFRVGEVVLIGNDNTRRLDWPLGVVQELVVGKDGQARLARLKTSSGILMRPIQRLFRLEVLSTEDQAEEESSLKEEEDLLTPEIVGPTKTRSGRITKIPKRYQE